MLNIRSNDPENENRSIPSIQEQELIGARLFHQLEKFLAQCYVSYFCKNYARIEKFVGDKYQTVLEIAYAIVVTNN